MEIELWKKFDRQGILDERLIDFLWNDYIDQKPGLLGLMKKFDLICDSSLLNTKNEYNKEYLVPSRAIVRYHEDLNNNTDRTSDIYQNPNYDCDGDNDIEDLTDAHYSKHNQTRFSSLHNLSTVEFFYDFSGFLPGINLKIKIKILIS